MAPVFCYQCQRLSRDDEIVFHSSVLGTWLHLTWTKEDKSDLHPIDGGYVVPTRFYRRKNGQFGVTVVLDEQVEVGSGSTASLRLEPQPVSPAAEAEEEAAAKSTARDDRLAASNG